MNGVRVGLQVLLAVAFLAAGLGKLTRQPKLVAEFRRMRLSGTLMLVAGATEVLAAVGLLVGFLSRPLTVVVTAALVVQMLLAAGAETRGGGPSKIAPPLVLAAAAALLGALSVNS